MSGWDQYHDVEALEAQLRARNGRQPLDSECEIERSRISRMFDEAKHRLGLRHIKGGDERENDT